MSGKITFEHKLESLAAEIIDHNTMGFLSAIEIGSLVSAPAKALEAI